MHAILFNFKKQKKITLSKPLIKIKNELIKKKNNCKIEMLFPKEEILLLQIKNQTNRLNKNNVTRTKAYLDFYNLHPEIHWAFLGHMVSRNGGWNMTDLKGSILSQLLSDKEAKSFFTFLERGNWLIFQDIYPQFLVYEESLKRGQNLFFLLPYLNISSFMETIWNHFWEEQDSYILTIALIINEQSYLEKRVIKNPTFKKEVFNTLEFKLQDLLSMSHILFPYQYDDRLILIGQTLNHFESLHERILLGKHLYIILFGDDNRLKMIKKWANKHPHTASRKDYWPHLFNDVNENDPRRFLKIRIKECQLIHGMPKHYSPRLEFAWKNQIHPEAEIGDWFSDWQIIYYLVDSQIKVDGEIEDDYCKTLEKLELAANTKKTISKFG
ncbi:DUF2515 domain-containing protein [Heyndrickxia sporothermodurans]